MGVEKQVLAEGSGASPTRGASVTVHCTGYGKDNDLSKKFWRCARPSSASGKRTSDLTQYTLGAAARRTRGRSPSRSKSDSAK